VDKRAQRQGATKSLSSKYAKRVSPQLDQAPRAAIAEISPKERKKGLPYKEGRMKYIDVNVGYIILWDRAQSW
jgi:hypothetical protein